MVLTSYNGWTASPDPHAIHIGPLTVAGHSFPGGVRTGDVATVLGYVALQFHRRVERLGTGCWGYSYRTNRNADNLSCHASGTAIDINAPRHPNGKAGTFTAPQVKTIHAILAEVGHSVRWGGDFHSTKDEMHFEVIADASTLHKVAERLRARGHVTTTASHPVFPLPTGHWFGRPQADNRCHSGYYSSSDRQRLSVWQAQMAKRGWRINTDGLFSEQTAAVALAFQREKHLPGASHVEVHTWDAAWTAPRT